MTATRRLRTVSDFPSTRAIGEAGAVSQLPAHSRGEFMYVTHKDRFRLEYAGETDRGQVRPTNQDAFLTLPECGVFAVADGVGGRNRGEVASAIAIDVVARRFKAAALGAGPLADLLPGKASELLLGSVYAAHREILKRGSADAGCEGMSTTLVAAFFSKTRVYIAHAGDSRCYLMEDGNLRQLTVDHTVAEELKRLVPYTPELENKLTPLRSMVVRCLGIEAMQPADIETNMSIPRMGQTYLLCSDGLWNCVSDDEIRDALFLGEHPELACSRLLNLADQRGAPDNVTAVVVRLV